MKNLISIIVLSILVAGCDEKNARTVTSLSGEGWKFTRDTTEQGTLEAAPAKFNDAGWDAVEVPHDWAIAGPFDPEGAGSTGKLPWKGVGWYRRSFDVTPGLYAKVQNGAALWLEFDGVMADAKVYVNGHPAGGWQYGYMGFRVDAAPFITVGKNSLAVRADTRDHRSRWYPGAGIYRDVRLVCAPAVHILPGSEFVSTPGVAKESATVHIEFAVTNRLSQAVDAGAGFRLDWGMNSAPESMVKPVAKDGTRRTIPARGVATFAFDVEVRNPHLWDVEDPQLYSARLGVVTKEDPESPDVRPVRFGIRTIAFPPDDGFHLNGRRVQIYGVDLHSDLGPLGMAFNRSAMRRQLRIMKDMGVNALRTSHNACDPQVLDLCDEMGIVVWNECFDKWDGTSGRRGDQNLEGYVEENLRAFAQRDRNHPSVIAWSIGNEIGPDVGNKGNGMSAERFRRFRNAIREFDTTRPVGIGCCHANAVDSGMFSELDISGWNYVARYLPVRARHPDKPILYTESASALSSYGYYEMPPSPSKTAFAREAHEVGSYDHNAAPWSDIPDWEFMRMERDRYVGGEFVWTGIDYLGEPTPYVHSMMKGMPNRELARSSYFGICDLMGLPKDRYYLYRSLWNKKAHTIHILPHWNWAGREGKNVPVYVYTDGDSAELFLNGKSLGKRVKGVRQQPKNFAQGKTYTCSSEQNDANGRNLAVFVADGDKETRWCAKDGRRGEWVQVDLGQKTNFRMVAVTGERGDDHYGWTIKVSDDGQTWRDYTKKALGKMQAYEIKSESARYVRLVIDQLKEGSWASVSELFVSDAVEAYQLNPYYALCDDYRLRWFNVPYQPGELKVVAYKQGEVIGEKTMRTAEKPVAVKLTAEPLPMMKMNELAFVEVDLVDAKGTRDPLATNRVNFKLTGPGEIVAVGNGNPRGYDSFKKTDSHPLYYGKAVVVVRRKKTAASADEEGSISLTASVDGLKSATVTWDALGLPKK
ncbi:MAG: DUF4982 domain-containing protein [Kiritimatiellae bacterium]|nr:DUF4982 domain-containing protein [Kiritimatiellia bacterium]